MEKHFLVNLMIVPPPLFSHKLEAAVLCDQHGLSYFKRIESTLQDLKGSSQDQPSEQTRSVEMMRKLITTIQEVCILLCYDVH